VISGVLTPALTESQSPWAEHPRLSGNGPQGLHREGVCNLTGATSGEHVLKRSKTSTAQLQSTE